MVYPFPLFVTKVFDYDEIKAMFKRVVTKYETEELDEELNPNLGRIMASVCLANQDNNVLFMCLAYKPKHVDTGLIAHEALHINSFNNYLNGIDPPDIENDEPNAYFIGWVANCIQSVIDDEPEIMNGRLITDDRGESD